MLLREYVAMQYNNSQLYEIIYSLRGCIIYTPADTKAYIVKCYVAKGGCDYRTSVKEMFIKFKFGCL